MRYLFSSGLVFSTANAFLNEGPIQLAGQALENVADVGQSILNAASDAATTAGIGASAAASLVGEVLNGQLALGSTLIPRPLLHWHPLSPISGVDRLAPALNASGSLGITLGQGYFPYLLHLPTSIYNNLAAAAQAYISQSISGIQSIRFGCTCFLAALFSLKPTAMPATAFYDTVRSIVDDLYVPDADDYLPIAPSDFVDRIRNALVHDWNLDVDNFHLIANDLTAAQIHFPFFGTGLFLRAVRDVCANMVVGPFTWPTEGVDILPNSAGGHWWNFFGKSLGPFEIGDIDLPINVAGRAIAEPIVPTARRHIAPVYDAADITITTDIGATLEEDKMFAEDPEVSEEIYPYPPGVTLSNLPDAIGVVTSSLGTLQLSASPKGEMTVKSELGTLPVSTMASGQAYVELPDGRIINVNPFSTTAVAYIAGVGDCPLRISTTGNLLVATPRYGTLPVFTGMNGRLETTLPGMGVVDVNLLAPVRALVYAPTRGTVVLTISVAGTISISIVGLGSIPVIAHADGSLTAYLPTVGTVRLQGIANLDVPVPLDYVHLPSFGYYPVSYTYNGMPVITVNGLGTFPIVVSSITGVSEVRIPRLGIFQVRSVVIPENPQDIAASETSPIWHAPSTTVVDITTSAGDDLVTPAPRAIHPYWHAVHHSLWTNPISEPITTRPTDTIIVSTPLEDEIITTPQSRLIVPEPIFSADFDFNFNADLPLLPHILAEPVVRANVASDIDIIDESPLVLPILPRARGSFNASFDTPFASGSTQGNWVWSLNDAAVYFLSKIDILRSPSLPPTLFLHYVYDCIRALRRSVHLLLHWVPPLTFPLSPWKASVSTLMRHSRRARSLSFLRSWSILQV